MARSADLVLVALAGVFDFIEGEQDLGGVIGVGIKLVVELEVPAAGLGAGRLHGPVAFVANFLREQPVGGLDHARIVFGHAGFAEGEEGLAGVPHRRHAGLHAEGGLRHDVAGGLLDAELFEFIAGADDLGIVLGVAEAAQREDGVQHGGVDGAEAVGHLEAIEHPFLGPPECQRAQGTDVHSLEPMGHAVGHEENVAPGEELFAVYTQAQDGILAAADEKLVNALLGRDLLERLFGVNDGQRNQDAARPRRDLVDIEIKPVGEEDDLRRDGGHGVVVVLAERAEVHFGEGVAGDHAAMGEGPLARLHHARIVGTQAHELGGEVALDRKRDIARAAGIQAPATVVVLVAHHLCEGAPQAARVAGFEKGVEEDVVGLEHRVGFEFAAPIAVRMLAGEDVPRGALDGGPDLGQVCIDSSEPG